MRIKYLFSVFFVLHILYSGLQAQGGCSPKYSSATNYSLFESQWDVVAVDLNGDGNLDLAATNTTANCVSVRYGTSNGTFNTIANFTANILTPFEIRTADFNNDGNADLVMTNSNWYIQNNPFGNQLTIMLGIGNGSFFPAVNYSVANDSYGIITEDFNSDGKIDIALANGTNLEIMFGTGTGSFTNSTFYATGGIPQQIVSNDFNMDGHKDIAVATQTSNVVILLGSATGTFSNGQIISVYPQKSIAVSSEDFDNDGKIDLGVITSGTFTPNAFFKLYNGTGTGTFVPSSFNSVLLVTIGLLNDLATGDFNMDGNIDLLTTYVNNTYPYIFLNNGSGVLSLSINLTTFQDPRGIAIGDFNTDTKPDIAITNYDFTFLHNVQVYLNTTVFPTVTATSSSSLSCAGDLINLTAFGASSYSWSTGQGSSVVSVYPITNAIYTVVGTATTGCQSTFTIQQMVQECTGLASLTEREPTFQFFPNPCINDLRIITNDFIFSVSIVNNIGQVIMEKKDCGEKEVLINTSSLSSGVYYLLLVCKEEDLIYRKKLIVDRE